MHLIHVLQTTFNVQNKEGFEMCTDKEEFGVCARFPSEANTGRRLAYVQYTAAASIHLCVCVFIQTSVRDSHGLFILLLLLRTERSERATD